MFVILSMVVAMIIVFGVALRIAAIVRRYLGSLDGGGALDDFVEFPPVQPHTAAFGAIVDFNALAVSHDQVGFYTYGAFHGIIVSLRVLFIG